MKKTFLVSLLSLLIFTSLGTALVYAIDPPAGTDSNQSAGTDVNNPTGTDSNKVAPTSGANIEFENPFKVGNTLPELLASIIEKVIFPIGGILAVLAFIYSGFLYVTAQGDTGKIKTAHTALLYAAVGTAVLLGAQLIANVIGGTIDQLK